MYIQHISLQYIKGFENLSLSFAEGKKAVKWVSLLGENGGGKSTILQAISLLLAGPEHLNNLLPVPHGWVRNGQLLGEMGITLQQGEQDPGVFGEQKISREFTYGLYVTGNTPVVVSLGRQQEVYTAPAFVEKKDRRLTWLKQNAFTDKAKGWFAAGYGAFRRLSRANRTLVPSLPPPARYTNFLTQFQENEPLSAFEQWLIHLDYRAAKAENGTAAWAKRQMEMGIEALNAIFPADVRFHSVTSEGNILFMVHGVIVPTVALSDGYRSVIALVGDLIWRMLEAFPQSASPLHEAGVVVIDELDIHLHPVWQRETPLLLRRQFPNIQFIVATHSPMIAAGAGEDAWTYRFTTVAGEIQVEKIADLSFMRIDEVLASNAFRVLSPFSPQTAADIDAYLHLAADSPLSPEEKARVTATARKAYKGAPDPNSLEQRIVSFLDKKLPL